MGDQSISPTRPDITLNDYFDELAEELRAAELLVTQKEAELAHAREQLAGAKRAIQLLAKMQQQALRGQAGAA